jgi:hypothetical protein
MTQKPNTPASNPFGTQSGSRPPAPLPGANRPGGLPTPPPRPTPAPRPPYTPGSTLTSRFGPARTAWEILPFSATIVRFSLEGLGGSLQRILGNDKGANIGTYDSILHSIEKNKAAMTALVKALESAWESYNLCGAILVYPWEQDTKQVILTHAKVMNTKAMCLRALDPILVLNVLARSRANLLQPRAPLALEQTYLERTFITDDERLVRLVQDSGYFEEVIPEEAKTDEDIEE